MGILDDDVSGFITFSVKKKRKQPLTAKNKINLIAKVDEKRLTAQCFFLIKAGPKLKICESKTYD